MGKNKGQNFLKEFKEFAIRGNVVDLTVGIVIGGAFGKIVTSFVQDVLMPPIGILLGGVDFSKLSLMVGVPVLIMALSFKQWLIF